MACPNCSANEYRAERVDAWKAAFAVLRPHKDDWGEEYGPASPRDVLELAKFLDGDHE